MLDAQGCETDEFAKARYHSSTADGSMIAIHSQKNIYVIGAQCTGKTTLVNALEHTFAEEADQTGGKEGGTPIVIREVARTVLREQDFSRDDFNSPARALQLQQSILEAQYNTEKAADADTSSSWYICDRSGLDPIAYAQIYVGKNAADKLLASSHWVELEKRMKAGIVVLCEAGCNWLVDDGTRLMASAEDWMRLDAAFRELLWARGIDYIIIPKDRVPIDERVHVVREAMGSQD